jgi:hypothetical protein
MPVPKRREKMMKSAVLAKEETKQVVQQLKRMEKGPEPTFRIKTHVSRMKPVDGTALSSTLPQEIPIEEVKQIGALQMSVLRIALANTTGDAIPLPKLAQECIKRIVIKANSGNKALIEFDKDSLMFPLTHVDANLLKHYDNGYVAATDETIAANTGTKLWYISILADPFALNQVYMKGLDRDAIRYEVEFSTRLLGLMEFQL